jgi:hypothetical protein
MQEYQLQRAPVRPSRTPGQKIPDAQRRALGLHVAPKDPDVQRKALGLSPVKGTIPPPRPAHARSRR